VSLSDLVDRPPWDFYERLQQCGVVWDNHLGGLLIGSHELVRSTLRQDETLYRRRTKVQADADPFLAGLLWSQRDITLLHGDSHRRFHAWWYQTVSRAACEAWRPTRIRPIVQMSIDRFIDRGAAELRADFAHQVPIRVIASILGLPWENDDWIDNCRAFIAAKLEYVEALERSELLDGPFGDLEDIGRRAVARTQEFAECVRPFAERAMAGKVIGNDLISMYARDGPDLFPDWGIDDMIAGILTAFFAGSDTPSYAVVNGIYLLLTHSDLQEELRVGGEPAVRVFVEEALRILGVNHLLSREVAEDTEIGGVEVKKGSTVLLVVGAANVDPQRYECPFDVKLDRNRPRDHTAFWMGPRACGGMWLARAELLEMYTALVQRLADLRLDPAAESPRIRGWMVRSYWPLHVRFTARLSDSE
jgi:cytochrome P450